MQTAVLFTALATVFCINQVASVQIFDLKTFLKNLQQQLKHEQDALYKSKRYSNEEEDTYGSLKNSDLENLLSYSSNKKSRSSHLNKYPKQQDLYQYELRRPFRQSEQLIPNELTGILNSLKQKSSPVTYISSSDESYENRDEEQNENPNEYSKVYVVLNSEAVKRSKNKDKLNALLSSLLSSPPAQVRNVPKRQHKRREHVQPLQLLNYNFGNYDTKSVRLPLINSHNTYSFDVDDEGHQQNEKRFKGFLLSGRKSLRDSGERFDEPERPRNRNRERGMRGGGRGGGGGGGGGTAVPYVHARGNIYEKNE